MLDLLLPRPCAGCGALRGPWCRACADATALPLLDVPVPLGPALAGAGGTVDGDLRVAAAVPYVDLGRRLLLAFKENGRHELAPQVAALLARAVVAAVLRNGGGGRGLRLVPVPSRARTRRERGADLGRLVAGSAARALRRRGWDAVVLPLLDHRARSEDQAGLARAARLRNLPGSLHARSHPALRPPDGGRLVLVDDIVTTGATLREAVRALVAAGHPVPLAAVVAATPVRAEVPPGSFAGLGPTRDTPGRSAPVLPLGADPLSSGGEWR